MLKRAIKLWLRWWANQILIKYQPRIVAITGSTGKTSTKDAILSVLVPGLATRNIKVAGTFGNLNTEFGVAATIIDPDFRGTSIGDKMRLTRADAWRLTKSAWRAWRNRIDYPQILVLELAADRPGDIAYFMEFIHPEIGVLTNIGDVHLEYFGSKAELAEEKGKLIAGTKVNGLAIMNRDDELTNLISKKTTARKVLIGNSDGSDARATNIALSGSGLHFDASYRGQTATLHLPVHGEQFVSSVLIALVVGDYFGISLVDAARWLANYRAATGRFEKIDLGRIILIDDTYNANPTSMAAALQSLSRLAGGKRRVAILGDMRELGSAYQKGHLNIGELVPSTADLLLTMGEGGALIRQAAIAKGMPAANAIQLTTKDEIFAHLLDGDMVLVKGSRAVHLDEIARLIKEKFSHE